MNAKEIKTYRKTHGISRIVTSSRGSWKWQDAFRVATYRLERRKCGLRWVCAWRSQKFSAPQMIKYGIDYHTGSLHLKPVDQYALEDYKDRAISNGVPPQLAERYKRLFLRLVAH